MIASTGPRSLERGETAPGDHSSGIATVASTGPRSLERGERLTRFRPSSGQCELQRGRAHWSAERRTGCTTMMRSRLELQRGRAHWSAESVDQRCDRFRRCVGFNGAALTGARRGCSRPDAPCDDRHASTGPRSLERGEDAARASRLPTLEASTGPRSLERGEARVSGDRGPRAFELQRGRAHWSAESESFVTEIRSCDSASTGPRSLERGEVLSRWTDQSRQRALQRGRAHWSAESSGLT